MAAARVHEHAPLKRRTGGRKAAHQARKHVVGHGEQDQVGLAENLAGIGDDRVGKSRARPAHRCLRYRGRRDYRVARTGQRRAERGTGPPGADNAHGEPGRMRCRRAGPGARDKARPRAATRAGPGAGARAGPGAGGGRAGARTATRAGLWAWGNIRVHLSFQSSPVPDVLR